MLILTVQLNYANIGLLGSHVCWAQLSNSSLQQVQLPKNQTSLPTQPGTGRSTEVSLLYKRCELKAWIAKVLLCRLPHMNTSTVLLEHEGREGSCDLSLCMIF